MVRERFGADWVSIFPSKWRAKELLRISQPHDYIYIILYLYIHHKGSHSGMHDHTTFIPCFDHGIGELPENPMVVPSLSHWNCIWGNHPISDQILLKRLVHKFMIHHDQGAGGSFLFVSDGVRWCTPPWCHGTRLLGDLGYDAVHPLFDFECQRCLAVLGWPGVFFDFGIQR